MPSLTREERLIELKVQGIHGTQSTESWDFDSIKDVLIFQKSFSHRIELIETENILQKMIELCVDKFDDSWINFDVKKFGFDMSLNNCQCLHI